MLQKESDFEAMAQKVSAYKDKIGELESLLSQERQARENLQQTQERLAEMNKMLKEVRARWLTLSSFLFLLI